MNVRSRWDVEFVDHPGYRYKRYLGALGPSEPPLIEEAGFGALRLFDDVTIDAGSRVRIEAHDGFEAVVYVLEGDAFIEDDSGAGSELAQDRAAYVLLGHGARHSVYNRSLRGPLRVLVAATVAP